VPLAISGQLADLSSPTNRSLTFEPRLAPPYSLPIMLPGVLGALSASAAGQHSVALTVGELTLDLLAVSGKAAPGKTVTLRAGAAPVTW